MRTLKNNCFSIYFSSLVFTLVLGFWAGPLQAQPIIIDNNSVEEFDAIPASMFPQIVSSWDAFYGHTSHGGQPLRGLDTIDDLGGPAYPNIFFEVTGKDLGHSDWDDITKAHLNQPQNSTNLVLWSWCGQVESASSAYIDTYLSKMSALEALYPNVIFVYMTGHVAYKGHDDNLEARNQQIRDYCIANNKVLFDYEAIEKKAKHLSWDPRDYNNTSSNNTPWLDSEFCSVFPGECPSENCVHAGLANCYRKGKAFWVMLARLSGWKPGNSSYNLTVQKSGTGTGTLVSSPAGIDCGSDCTENYPENTTVNLKAHSGVLSKFESWSGDCSGSANCTLNINSNKSVTAQFTKVAFSSSFYTISASQGGILTFMLDAGKANANRDFLILGSTSGTSPGYSLPGGLTVMPLNWDLYTTAISRSLNKAPYDIFLGKLDNDGLATVNFMVAPFAPSHVGLEVYYAFTLGDPFDFVSNPITIEVVN